MERQVLRITTLGGLSVADPVGPIKGAGGRSKPLALLALVASAGDRGVSRDKLLTYLWPEADAESARAVLRQTLYALRRDLRVPDVVVGTMRLRLNPDVATSDVAEFGSALDRGELERAVALYRGPFLDGFHLGNAPEFERWMEDERRRHEQRVRVALESLASDADRDGEHELAVAWWRQLAVLDPYNSRAAMGLMRALASSGDPAAAIGHARLHEQRVREDLDSASDPAVTLLLEQIRTTQHTASVPLAVAVPPNAALPAPTEPARFDPKIPADASRGTRRRVPLTVAVGLAAVIISIGAAVSRTSERVTPVRDGNRRAMETKPPLDSALVAVMPFNVAVSDSALGYLGEGIVDLLAVRLGGEGGPRAADPQAVIDAWERVMRRGVPGPDAARDIGRHMGAGQVLQGGIVGNRQRLTISAALLGTSDGRVRAEASVEGSADSIVAIADRLAARLLAQRAGEVEPRLGSLTSTSLPALKAYLAGQASYRRGRYGEAAQHFLQAIEYDSTFALAAFHLGLASGWARRPRQEQGRALRLAWGMRDRLSKGDRKFLTLYMAASLPTRTLDVMATFEQVVAANPDRQEVWYEYGDRLMHSGWPLEIESAHDRAAAAFARALELDSIFVPAITHLLQLAARAGDTALVRRLGNRYLASDSTGELATFIRWRMAVSSGDTALVARVRMTFDAAASTSLQYIAETSLYDGVAIEDGQLAVDALVRRASTREERFDALLDAHALALSRGRPATALAITDALGEQHPGSRVHLRLRVTDALYGSGDSVAAAAAVIAIAPHADAPPAAGDEERANQYKDMCVVEQWRLAHGTTERTRRAIDLLRVWDLPVGSNVGYGNGVCALLLDALLEQQSGGVGAAGAVARLEASLRTAPGIDEMLAYAPIALARLHEAQGHPAAALRAIRRRFYFAFWPHYLATHLREEARLAALAGDDAGARRAYRHYAALRSGSESAVALEADSLTPGQHSAPDWRR